MSLILGLIAICICGYVLVVLVGRFSQPRLRPQRIASRKGPSSVQDVGETIIVVKNGKEI